MGVIKTRIILLHQLPDAPSVERYIEIFEVQIRKIVASHQTDGDAKLPIFLLSFRASTHETMGLDLGWASFRERTATTLRPAVCRIPRQETTHNRSYGKFSGPSTRHSQLCRQNLKLDSDGIKTDYHRLGT
jgi:hypothetical protein